MPAYDLEILRQNRQEILKAELGAFLHNIGKFGEEFINWSVGGPQFGYHVMRHDLLPRHSHGLFRRVSQNHVHSSAVFRGAGARARVG